MDINRPAEAMNIDDPALQGKGEGDIISVTRLLPTPDPHPDRPQDQINQIISAFFLAEHHEQAQEFADQLAAIEPYTDVPLIDWWSGSSWQPPTSN